jgi:endonuclease/exonuclease/phosphatase family metal-dependent hydrolase
MKLSVVTYNIHKGFQHTRRVRVLHWIRDALREDPADMVFLQEVLGFETAEQASQLEFLADSIWHHHAYGQNAVTSLGHHGNAILSRYPIVSSENTDISTNSVERRGILHAEVQVGALRLHALSIHLGLLESERRSQVRRVCHRIHRMIHRNDPVIIAGDFNDWRERASPIFQKRLGISEAYRSLHGEHARTFPSWMPALRLDRIYFRGMKALESRTLSGPRWNRLSDHLALQAVLDFSDSREAASTACSSSPRSSSTV